MSRGTGKVSTHRPCHPPHAVRPTLPAFPDLLQRNVESEWHLKALQGALLDGPGDLAQVLGELSGRYKFGNPPPDAPQSQRGESARWGLEFLLHALRRRWRRCAWMGHLIEL